MAEAAKYRYPGPPEFEDTASDRRRFFGRDSEINTVSERIIASRLLVVYGNSGLGKSSLLKAGVFPKLRAEGLLPVRVRLDRSASIGSLMRGACEEAARDVSRQMEIDYTPGAGGTAWEFFKTVMFWHGDTLLMPVLMFDQFEEIFTLADAAWRKEFALEIGPLASGNTPAAVREKLKAGTLGFNDQAPKVKIVICLREEYYGSLQEMSGDFPGLFQERFRLQPLDTKQAELAIVEPARLAQDSTSVDGFVTPRFEYEQASLDSMLAFLRGKSQFVEPFQLQLLCQFVEQVIVAKKQAAKCEEPIVISPGDLGGEDAMDQVIRRFYADSLNQLPPHERRHARELCDTGLLSESGNRLMLEEDQIRKEYKVSDATLRYLADERRILRQEPRLDSTFYEISHDTIARSIFESRRWRVPKKWRLAGAVSAVFVLALAVIAVWAVLEKRKAEAAKQIAFGALKQAELQRSKAAKSEATATAALGKADESRNKAENVVAFLMGEDFLAAIRPMGKMDAFEDIERAVPCKDAEGAVTYDAIELRNLGLACINEGELDFQQFHLSDAVLKYEAARKHFAAIAARQGKPYDPDLADALMKLAEVAEDQLELDKAVALTRQSLEIEEHLLSLSATGHKVSRDVATNYLRLGELKRKQGYLSEAVRSFEKVVALCKPAGGELRDSAEWNYLMQDALLGRAAVLALQGYPKESEADYKQAYDYAEQAVAKNPFAPQAKYRAGVALSYLPFSADQEKRYREVFSDVDSAASWDTKNKVWERDRAATDMLLGEALVGSKKWDEAAKEYRKAIEIVEALIKIDPSNRQLRSDMLVRVHESLGNTYLQQDSATAAKFSVATKAGSGDASEPHGGGKPSVGDSQSMALGEYQRAQELWKPLASFARQDQELRNQAARIAIEVASVQRSLPAGNDEALKSCDHAGSYLVARDPTDANYREFRYWLEEERGDAFVGKGEKEKAAKSFAAAGEEFDWLLTHRPNNAKYWNGKFLLLYDHIVGLRKSAKDSNGALKAYQQALEAINKAASIDPGEPGYRENLGLVQQGIGDIQQEQGQLKQAQEQFNEAEKVWRELIRTNGAARYWNRLFLLYYDHIGQLRKSEKDAAATLKVYQQALEAIEKAASMDPNEPVYQESLGLAHWQVGDALIGEDQWSQAQEQFTAAETVWRELVRTNGAAKYWNRLHQHFYLHVASLREKQKDAKGTLQAYQDSLEPIRKAVALDPKEAVYQENLASAEQRIGDTLQEQGQLGQAQEHFSETEKVWRELIRTNGAARYWNLLFLLFYDHIGPLGEKQKDPARALQAYLDSLEAVRKAIALDPAEPVYPYNLALAQQQVGDRLRDQGKFDEAKNRYAEAEKAWRNTLSLSNKADSWNRLFLLYFDHLTNLRAKQKDQPGVFKAQIDSIEFVEKAIALDPTEAVFQSNLAFADELTGDTFRDQGEMGQAQERYAGAEKAWRAAIQLKDTVEYWYDLYLLFYDHMTDKQKDEGLLLELYRKSYSAVSKASALEPKEPFYLAKSAEALQQIAQRETEAEALASYSHAEQALHEAVRLKPGESGYWYSLALTYDREGQIHEKKQEGALAQANYRDALNALEQSAKLSPDARTADLRSKLLNKVAAGKQ